MSAFRSERGAAGGWAHLLGSVLAMLLPVALGFGLTLALAAALPAEPARSPIPLRLQPWLSAMAVSPAFTWLALLPGIPFAVSAARRGWAGWASFALAGGALWLLATAIVGSLLYSVWVDALGPGGSSGSILGGLGGMLSYFLVGAVVGLSYWLGLRLAAPRLFRNPGGRMAS